MASSFSDVSEDDRDASFEEDMEALRRACLLTGTNPSEIQPSLSVDEASESEADSDDDLKLVRSIRERFSFPSDGLPLPVFKSERSLAPGDSDEEDDFETLRAIQRRFVDYDRDGMIKSDNIISKDGLACTTTLTLDCDTSTVLLKNSNNREALGEGFPDSSDIVVNSQLSNVCDSCPGSEPSDSIEWHQQEGKSCDFPTALLGHATFPEIAQMFIAAIKKNRSCQKFIRSKLIQIEGRIEENKGLKERVKCLMDFQSSCKRRASKLLSQQKDPRVKLISLPKARTLNTAKVKDKKVHASCLGPAENSHVPKYRMVLTKFPVALSRQQWSKVEKENLAKGIKQQFQEVLLQRSMEHYSGLEGPSGDYLDDISKSIANLEITPENIRCFLPQVDWGRLASMYVMGRSGAECQTRWLNHEDPMINSNQWTNPEDKNLLLIVQRRGIYNWIEIATEIATSMGKCRTPFQCLARYQGSLNAYILKRDWTEDEDAQLRAAVETLGESDWQRVASTLGGRTGTQCSNRWRKSLHPSRQRVGRWSVDEDKRLKISVMLFGPKSWNKIAEFIPGRTQVQCRERWFNTLDPSLKLGPWSEEEDYKLKAAITEHGYYWSKVAACLCGRTDSQCRRRWKVLFPHEVPLLQAARKIQRVALISNFVDREEQRPALGPSDFVSASLEVNYLPEDGNKKKNAKRRKKSSDDPQLNSSKKSGTKAKTHFEESSREMNDDDVLTSHGDYSKSLSKKRTKKRVPKSHLNGSKRVKHGEPCEDRLHSGDSIFPGVADDASLDGNSMHKVVSQEPKAKRSRTKYKVSPQEAAAELEHDNDVISHGDDCNSIPKKRTKKSRKAHPSLFERVEQAEAYSGLSHPENAILSTVENYAPLNVNSRPKVTPCESKVSRSMKKQKLSRKRVAEIEYDDDATLASVFCDILKRRRLKHASTLIVSDQAIEGFTVRMEKGAYNLPVERDRCNQPAEDPVDRQCREDSILRIMHSNDVSVFHGRPKTDDISQLDNVRNLITKRKNSHQENSIMMNVSDRSIVDQGVVTFCKGNTISRKHDKKACKSGWVDKRIHPVKECIALPPVGQLVLQTVDTCIVGLDGSDTSIMRETVLCGKLKQDSHKKPESELEFGGRCCFAADREEEPLASHETAILLQDCEAESLDEQTTPLALPCGTNPNLAENVSLPSEVMDADSMVDNENCCPFGDSNGGLDDLLLSDGGMVGSALDFFASDDINVTEAPLASSFLEGVGSLQPNTYPFKT